MGMEFSTLTLRLCLFFGIKDLWERLRLKFHRNMYFSAQGNYQNACGKLVKKIQKLFKKYIDISIFSRYYRDSFWIKKLFKRSKQKFSQNNSTLYKRPVFLAVTGLFLAQIFFLKKNWQKKQAQKPSQIY